MASPLQVTPAFNYIPMNELEKGCELPEILFQSQFGLMINDGTDSQFGHPFQESSHTFALSQETSSKSDHSLLVSKMITSQSTESTKINRRRGNDKSKGCQRRKVENKRTELTLMPEHDGYLWRKYGQKNILKQRYPRSYYRCTYHHDQNCMATKQVQQCNDENPPLFKVSYFDEHTCKNTVPSSEPKFNNNNILDFSGKSIPEWSLSTDAKWCRRQEEDATLVSCFTNVIKGYNSEISEDSNGGDSALNCSNESFIPINDSMSSIESTMLWDEDFPMVHGIPMDLEWFEQDNLFLW